MSHLYSACRKHLVYFPTIEGARKWAEEWADEYGQVFCEVSPVVHVSRHEIEHDPARIAELINDRYLTVYRGEQVEYLRLERCGDCPSCKVFDADPEMLSGPPCRTPTRAWIKGRPPVCEHNGLRPENEEGEA